MQERLSALEAEMGAAGFWDDPEAAAKVGAEHTRTQRRLDAFTKLQSDAEDLDELAEMAEEDESMAADLEDAIASVEATADRRSRSSGCSPATTTRATRS